MIIFTAMSFWYLVFYSILAHVLGVIRHGIDKNESLKLAQQPAYQSVGMFTQQGRMMGSCVLIHPRMALTAAHTLTKLRQGELEIEFDSIRVRVDSFFIHPWYSTHKGADIAILYLSRPIRTIKIPALNKSRKEKRHISTAVGFGNFSVANNPKEIVDAGRLKSAGQNVLDSIAGLPLPNKLKPFLFADFDNPVNGKLNKSGDTVALHLEFGLDGGDSGGGMFIKRRNKEVLAGINAIQNKNIGDILRTGAFYGSSSEWVRISVFKKWIGKKIKQFEKHSIKDQNGSI